jgi:hypothetical protein
LLSRAAWRGPLTQIHDLPWPRCPPPVARVWSRGFKLPAGFEPTSPTECNGGATPARRFFRKSLIG